MKGHVCIEERKRQASEWQDMIKQKVEGKKVRRRVRDSACGCLRLFSLLPLYPVNRHWSRRSSNTYHSSQNHTHKWRPVVRFPITQVQRASTTRAYFPTHKRRRRFG